MKKVLLVDDDEDILLLTKTYFEFKGHVVRTSATCRDAWKILADFRPDIIFLDINVGDEDGREFCQQLKREAAWLNVPVYFISARQEEANRYQRYGASGFFEKPFELSELLAILSK